ncbi:uncharacterized protein LOC107274656 isoform X2 [Cephus cinctus]|nr:uncharacterized protein LOC107274656 isoform X2 [Cephus cinctus]
MAWAVAAYTRAMRRMPTDKHESTWPGLTLQAFWRGGMLASRMAALVLAAVCVRKWIFLLLGIHWSCMTIWVILQNTNFCPTVWEERVYNCIIGVIYCFDFFNLREGRSRYRVLAFYLITVAQNTIFLTIYVVYFKDTVKSDVMTTSTITIAGGTLIGLVSLLLYYSKFHSVGHGRVCKNVKMDPEMASNSTIERTGTLRSLKHRWHGSAVSIPRTIDLSEVTIMSDDITADKKSLLTNIVQSSEFVEEEGIINGTCEVSDEGETTVCALVESNKSVDYQVETVQNSTNTVTAQNMEYDVLCAKKSCEANACQTKFDSSAAEVIVEDEYIECDIVETLRRQKRRGICSPVELGLDTDESKSEDPKSTLRSQKRRGICSSAQLGLELVTNEDNYVEKNFTFERRRPIVATGSEAELKLEDLDSYNNALEAAISVMNIDEIPDNIKDRERLNTPVSETSDKTLEKVKILEEPAQKEEETMSHVTSVHDYENVCPLGIARPPWCIRSWKGYTDIETYIHDDSVVRDRRRDTLTSSATGTTFSSEFSDATCASPLARRASKRSRQDDYMDTLVYDLVDWEPSLMSNEEASMPALSDIDEQETSLFMAKPIVIDEKGGMFALDTIMEEREDSSTNLDIGINLKRATNCTASTLVATIDEIRKCTAENSPRHVYHRTELQWEDLEPKIFLRKAQLAKALSSSGDFHEVETRDGNILRSLDDCMSFSAGGNDEIEIIRELAKRNSTGSSGKTPLINAILSDSPILGPKAKMQKYSSIADSLHLSSLEEHNVYVEMKPLVPEKSEDTREFSLSTSLISAQDATVVQKDESTISEMTCQGTGRLSKLPKASSVNVQMPSDHQESNLSTSTEKSSTVQDKEKNVLSANVLTLCPSDLTSSLMLSKKGSSQVALINSPYSITGHVPCEKRRRTVNRPRRKFSLLRERFEPKSERLVYTVTPRNGTSFQADQSKSNKLDDQVSIIFKKSPVDRLAVFYDKENLTPAVTSRISHWNSFIHGQNCAEPEKHDMNVSLSNEESSLKERRSIFLKQVLSPPKFQSWGKKRTFSPNAKVVPKAL